MHTENLYSRDGVILYMGLNNGCSDIRRGIFSPWKYIRA